MVHGRMGIQMLFLSPSLTHFPIFNEYFLSLTKAGFNSLPFCLSLPINPLVLYKGTARYQFQIWRGGGGGGGKVLSLYKVIFHVYVWRKTGLCEGLKSLHR